MSRLAAAPPGHRDGEPLWSRLCLDEAGEDLVEYALLTACLALAGAAAFSVIANILGGAYGSWDTGNQGLWEPPNPQ